MANSSTCRIAVIVRAHVASDKLDDLIEALARPELFDTYVMANETRGALSVGSVAKLPYTLDTARELGFEPASEWDIVYCSDLLFEHLRRCLPQYDFYVLIEFDVDLVRERGAILDDLARKLSAEYRDLDMAGTMVSPRGEGWAHYPKAAKQFPDVHMVFFPLVVLSQRAILHLYRARLTEGSRTMPMQERSFCEAFVASALVPAPGFRCADLNDLLPGCYQRRTFYWGLPMLHGGPPPHDSDVEMRHPVYSGPEFLEAHFKDAAWTQKLPHYRAMLNEAVMPLPGRMLRDWGDKADSLLRDLAPSLPTEAVLGREALQAPPPVVLLVEDRDLPLREETDVKPRAMTMIDQVPLIEHALACLTSAGCSEFIVPLGPDAEAVASRLKAWTAPEPERNLAPPMAPPVSMRLLQVSECSATGRRIKAAAEGLDRRFLVVFGHVVSDIDLRALLAAHEQAGKLATIVAVQPAGMVVALDGDVPAMLDRHPYPGLLWTNGGYMVFEPGALDFIQDGDLVQNGDLSGRLEAAGELAIFDFRGFWQSADTTREVDLLRRLVRARAETGIGAERSQNPMVVSA